MHRLPPPLLLLLTVGCSSYSLDKASADSGYGSAQDYDSNYGGDAVDETGADDGYGSEEENDFLSLLPATTRRYVFVVNTERDTVSRVSVPELEVITVDVGVRPSVIATSADYTRAVTFNTGSDDLSIIDAETLEVETVSVQPNLNQMAVSPDGRWAVVYHDVSEVDEDDPPEGAISYNEISLVDLDRLIHIEAVVGTFPHGVEFTDDGATAVVISDDYLAVLDLTADDPYPVRIPLAEGTLDPPAAEEVLLPPSGEYAFVRQYGVSDLVLVDLLLAETELLPVGANPTDMDLSPDKSEAIVVARNSSELWVFDVSDPRATPKIVDMPTDDIYGSILMSPDNTRGLLFSTQSGQARYGVWDRETDTVSTHSLKKPVASVGVSPRGNTALVFHTLENGDISPTSSFYDKHALTLIELDGGSFFPNPIQLEGEPIAYANAADGETGYFIMEGLPYLGVLDYEAISHHIEPLPSEPVHLGALPEEDTAFVNQSHPLGRLSFYDPDVGPDEAALQTITGFELNSAIEQ
ncbi:MAG: DNA-binding beta-propeller fold protein YncE [Myxococcota bacterium]|jgi:DNA-binding beta-propeller fold protein YncE